ncbi:helix-turn-helix domain-containing protein [Qipengyuania sp.]|uniref:helix-turn-helix domain-containing protein n=1 Tax=Qipengyuania sp. TaxID=2004515 RepID=UPI0035154A54
MAITQREQQMIDLRDQGMNDAAIARAMGIKRGSVRRTLSVLSVDLAGDARHEQAIRQGTQSLLAAIGAAGYPTTPRPEHRR